MWHSSFFISVLLFSLFVQSPAYAWDNDYPTVNVGAACGVNTICRAGLQCQGHICRIKRARECTATPNLCVRGAVCAGTAKRRVCTRPLGPGADCTEQKFSACRRGLMCKWKRCRTPTGNSCRSKGSLCFEGATCAGSGKDKKCVDIIAPGDKCKENNVFSVCARGTTCSGGVCKTPEGGSCIRSGSVCVDGTTCAGTVKEKKCVPIIKPGGICKEKNPFSVCTTGTVCNEGFCKTPSGNSCLPTGSVCVSGTTCAGTEKDKKCVPILEPGAKCKEDSPFSVCKKDLVCSGGRCKTPKGGNCEPSGSICVSDTVCAGRKGKKRCVTPRVVGEECGTNVFRVCKRGLVCEDKKCNTPRIPEAGMCQAPGSRCKKGLVCVGKPKYKLCVRPLGPNKACGVNTFTVCQKGLVCSGGRCKTPIDGDCMPKGSVCVRGAICIGTKKKKICVKPSKLGDKCGSPFLECEGKLICFRRKCVLPKRSLGKECSHIVRCQEGLSCRYIKYKRKAFCTGVSKRGERCNMFLSCQRGDRCRFGKCVRGRSHPW